MTSRVIAFLLSSTLFIPFAFAQQAGSNSAAQGPVRNVGTICKEPLTPATGKDFWKGDQPNTANLVGHGLNRKRDVQRVIKPIQNCLDDLSEAASSQTKTIKDVDSQTQQGIQLASSKADDADKNAGDATNRASAALQAANQTTTRVSNMERIVSNTGQYKAGAPTEIRFRPGQSTLSKAAKEALDQIGSSVKDQRNYVIEVHGYSPGQGQAAITNSLGMADSVVRYLVLNYPIPVYRIFVLGMGNAETRDNTAKRSTRRVEVSVLNNEASGNQQ